MGHSSPPEPCYIINIPKKLLCRNPIDVGRCYIEIKIVIREGCIRLTCNFLKVNKRRKNYLLCFWLQTMTTKYKIVSYLTVKANTSTTTYVDTVEND